MLTFESPRFCAGLRYLSGEAFTGGSKLSERSGMLEDKLMKDPGLFALITESSFACEDVSDEDVDTDAVVLWLPTGPWDVVGAEIVRISGRRFGVDEKA